MELTVNGKAMMTSSATIRELLDELGIDPAGVAVEHNLEIVPVRMQESRPLRDADRVEIVHMVGGG
jgi:thiamine biosynthesis protein ThiS